jgi:hypothetical protein
LNYTDVRRYQNELTVAKDSLKAQQETYDIAYWRQQAAKKALAAGRITLVKSVFCSAGRGLLSKPHAN